MQPGDTQPGGPEYHASASDQSAGWIGPYRVEGELARGGMGVVYRAFHSQLGRPVAIKVQRSGASPKETERFRIEAQAAARLRHPNIAGIHEVGALPSGDPFLVMDLIEGGSLKQKLEAEGPLDLKEAAQLIATLARAVAFAHGHNILHRDIKPANVLLNAQGAPVLTDFGLAKQVGQDQGVTVTGQVMGTPSYMPPEQADGDTDRVDRRADVYSLGATLYALITGRPPFQGDSAIQVIASLLGKPPVSPRKLRPEVDRDLETICLQCLEKEPDQRYPTALSLAGDLERYLADDPIEARPVGALERWWRRARRRPALMAGIGTALVAAITVLGIALFVTAGALRDSDVARAEEAKQRARAERREDDARRAEAAARAAEAQTEQARRLALVQAELERGYQFLSRGRYARAARTFAEAAERLGGSEHARARAFRAIAARGAGEGILRYGVVDAGEEGIDWIRFVPGGAGRRVALGIRGRVKLAMWSASAGLSKAHATAELVLPTVLDAAVSSDGRLLALGHRTRPGKTADLAAAATSLVTVWELPSLKRRASFGLPARPGQYPAVSGLAFNDDASRLIYSEQGTGTAVLIDLVRNREEWRIASSDRPKADRLDYVTTSRAVGARGRYRGRNQFLVGYLDGTVSLWEGPGRHLWWTNLKGDGPQSVRFLGPYSFGAQGRPAILTVGREKGYVSAIRTDRPGEARILLDARAGSATAGDLREGDEDHPDLLAVCSADGTLRLWASPSTRELARFRLPPRRVTHCSISSRRDTLLVNSGRRIYALDLSRVQTFRGQGPLAVDGAGRLLARLRNDRVLDVYDLRARRLVRRLELAKKGEAIRSLSLSRGGRRLVAGVVPSGYYGDAKQEDAGTAVLVDLEHGGARRLPAPQPRALALRGDHLAVGARSDLGGSACPTGRVAVTPLKGGSARLLEWHLMSVTALAYAPDGALVSGAEDGTVALWSPGRARTPARVLDLRRGRFIPGSAISAVLLPDRPLSRERVHDQEVVRALEDRFMTLTGRPKERIHEGSHVTRSTWGVRALALDAAGRLLVTGTGDARVRVWDLASGTLQTVLEVDDGLVAVGFLSDGRLALATRGGTVQVWELALDETLREARDRKPRGGHVLRTIETGSSILHAALGGDTFAASCEDLVVRAWDLSPQSIPGFESRPVKAVNAALKGE